MIRLNVSEFHWSKSDNTFYAQEWEIVDLQTRASKDGFVIFNPKTGNEKVFDYVSEEKFDDPIIGNYSELLFISVEGIKCKIMTA